MIKEEHDSRENIFIHEVCKTYCKLCSVNHPEFCMFFFADMGKKYFTNLMLLIKVAHEKKPRLIEALKSFEGFVALFCNHKVCQFHSSKCDIGQKLDCYQMYLTQSKQYLEEGEADNLIRDWDNKLFKELCYELDDITNTINNMSKKKRKRLLKIGTHIANLIERWGHGKPTFEHSSTKSKKVKKEVSTQLFHNDNKEWADRIKSILEGDNHVEDLNKQ